MCRTLPKPAARIAACSTSAAILALLICAISAQAAEKKSDNTADEKIIRAAIESYVGAYNRGDAKAVASHWGKSAEWISPSGERFRGSEAIEKKMKDLFAENKGVCIEVLSPSIRIVSSDVAIEEGTVRVVRPGESADDSTYLAVHVKKDGQWKLDSVRETSVAEAPTASPELQDLAWLVGQWGDQSPDSAISASVTWTRNKTFLSYAFKASAPDMDDLEGTQIIGWDPAVETIRSWMFDSDGGFGEGAWSKEGDSWVVKFSQTLPDGRKASATNIYTPIDANSFKWKSIGRKVGGDALPDVEEVTIVRKTVSDVMKEAGKDAEKSRTGDMKK